MAVVYVLKGLKYDSKFSNVCPNIFPRHRTFTFQGHGLKYLPENGRLEKSRETINRGNLIYFTAPPEN